MKPSRFRPRPGRRAAVSLARLAGGLVAAGTLLLGGCLNYGLSGGGGFPSSIKTVCIEPFDNQTDHAELTGEVFTALNQKLPGALGLRQGDCKSGADATIRGKIVRYDDSAASYSANTYNSAATQTGAQQQVNQVTVGISVQIIDRKRNLLLWDGSGVSGIGTYKQGENDASGRKAAVDKLVQAVIDGAQSQW